MSNFLILVLAVGAMAVALAIGALVLIKLGVIAHYALRDEAPDQGDYELDQSREAGEE
jgi:hypothetical protein